MLSAEKSLARLKEGNRRFLSGELTGLATFGPKDREQLVIGQHPFAVILGCSDSRVPIELLFDQGFGDLFVIRIAGNVVARSQLGSVEYAIQELGVKLVVVMGHAHCGAVAAAIAAPAGDLVTDLPGFGNSTWPFKLYSGYLTVPGPFQLTDYDSLEIHYQLHMSQNNPSSDPLVTWHQGGPGGSSIDVGLYTEMGYFQISDQGYYTNEFAWNKVAHMLYLESPAGSGQSARTSRANGSFLISSSVDRWYLRISRSATVPGLRVPGRGC